MPAQGGQPSAETGIDTGPAGPDPRQAEPAAAAPAAGRADELPAPSRGTIRALLQRIPPSWRLPLATFLACQVIFLAWWAAFYPGLMSYDSVIYVMHVTTGPWIDNHSVLYDSFVWLSLHVTGGLAALTLAQTVAMSATFGYTVSAFRRLGVPGRWTAAAAIVLAALPPTGAFILFVWKDVAFTICTIVLVPTLAQLVSLQRQPGWHRNRRAHWLIAAIGLEFLGIMLFRLNGFLVVLVALAIMLAVLPGIRLRLAAVTAAGICVVAFLNLVVFPAAGIERPAASLSYGPAYGDIAVAYAERPAVFSKADLRLMARVAPLRQWASSANCYDSDPTNRVPGIHDKSAAVSGKLFQLWVQTFKRAPDLIIGARLCRGAIAWRIFPGSGLASTLMPIDTVPANLFLLAPKVRDNPYRTALHQAPLSATLNAAANFWWNVSRTPQLNWLLWRGAFWSYLAYGALIAFARFRRSLAVLSLGAIVAGQQLAVMADIPAQLYRYMVSPIFIGILLVPLFFARRRAMPPAR